MIAKDKPKTRNYFPTAGWEVIHLLVLGVRRDEKDLCHLLEGYFPNLPCFEGFEEKNNAKTMIKCIITSQSLLVECIMHSSDIFCIKEAQR